MYTKKIIFTATTVPFLGKFNHSQGIRRWLIRM